MSHYFTNDKELKECEKELTFYFNGEKCIFKTNSGMFSNDYIDEGTTILLNNIKSLSGDVLDLGCAYGVVGITALKSFKEITSLTMTDVNLRALEYAKINLELNEVFASVIQSDSFENIDKNFDNIILNPPIHAGKQVIFDMYEKSFEHLNENGKLFIVIRQKHGAKSTIKKLEEVFNKVNILYKEKGVFVLEAVK